MAFVYMLKCRDGSLYTGAAKDLDARIAQHREGRGSRYTRAHLPVELVWSAQFATWSEALREEARVKRLPRGLKSELAHSKT
jgi:putative endonuclease